MAAEDWGRSKAQFGKGPSIGRVTVTGVVYRSPGVSEIWAALVAATQRFLNECQNRMAFAEAELAFYPAARRAARRYYLFPFAPAEPAPKPKPESRFSKLAL